MFSKLKNKTILITGGTGYFGKVLTDHFLKLSENYDLGIRLILTARNLIDLVGVEFVESDIRETLKIPGNIDYIIHAATPVANDTSSPNELLDVIINGTQTVLNLAVDKKVSKIINISSGAVYGTQAQDVELLHESSGDSVPIFDPSNIYGTGKRIAENLVGNLCKNHQINYLTLRCFAFSGIFLPLDAQFAIGNFVRDAKSDGVIRIKGDGSAVRSYLDSGDLAEWILTALLSDTSGKTYNVGSEQAISILELAQLVASLIPGSKVEVENRSNLEIKKNRYIPCVSSIMKDLGVTQKVSLKQSVENMINFERQ